MSYEDDYINDADRAYMESMDAIEGYCDYCETSGHTFRTCSRRDDDHEDQYEDTYGEIREDDIDYDTYDEVEAAKGRHPSSFGDEDYETHKAEDAYEKYLDRMKEHGP